jgi:hypothetical protein
MKQTIFCKTMFFCTLLAILPLTGNVAQTKAEKSVRELLTRQAEDWNKGDIEAFMQGYWKSEKLQFIGSRGLSEGWQNTLENYKNGYPDKAAMGQLRFELLSVDRRSRKVVTVVGKFILTRDSGEVLDGHFLLVCQKIKGQWYVVADHTS